MFFVGAEEEYKASRAEKNEGKKSGNEEEEKASDIKEEGPPGDGLSREQVLSFFAEVTAALHDESCIAEMASKVTAEDRPSEVILEKQMVMLEEQGVSRTQGINDLNGLPSKYGDDEEILTQMRDFAISCQSSFVKVLKKLQPEKLETKAKLSRGTILEFFEACDAIMELPETKEELSALYKSSGEPPSDRIVEYQKEVIEMLGYEREHGVNCLNQMHQDFPDDMMLQRRMQKFAMVANMACQEAVVGREQLEKQMHLRRKVMMKQQQLAAECSAMTKAEKAQFIARVMGAQVVHAKAMLKMTTEERTAYIQALPQEEQNDLAKLNVLTGGGPGQGMGGGHSHSYAHCEHG
ncbi:unnamed protein product, partial [Chrysoparadoxa australica]